MRLPPLAIAISLAFGSAAAAQAPQPDGAGLERGTLPVSWSETGDACATQPDFRLHEYNPDFFILRQSGCTNYEKPFLYLIFGDGQALLLDSGAKGAKVADAIARALKRWADARGRPRPKLIVAHSHAPRRPHRGRRDARRTSGRHSGRHNSRGRAAVLRLKELARLHCNIQSWRTHARRHSHTRTRACVDRDLRPAHRRPPHRRHDVPGATVCRRRRGVREECAAARRFHAGRAGRTRPRRTHRRGAHALSSIIPSGRSSNPTSTASVFPAATCSS